MMQDKLADPLFQRVAEKFVEREVKKNLPLVMKKIGEM